jgi:hypothetical protein
VSPLLTKSKPKRINYTLPSSKFERVPFTIPSSKTILSIKPAKLEREPWPEWLLKFVGFASILFSSADKSGRK